MELQILLSVLFRWMHILAAITAVGGSIFMRFALLPSTGVLPEEQHQALREQVRSRWAKAVALSIVFLLASGIYNIVRIMQGGVELPGYYHALFGIKFLIAFAIFFLASALTGKSPALAKIRENAKFYLTVNVVLAVVLVCISGVLRVTRDYQRPETPAVAEEVGP